MKRFVKKALSHLAPADVTAGFRILLYHSIERRVAGDRLALRVDPPAFTAQMEALAASRRPVVPLADALRAGAGGIAITFDDGYRDHLERAAPVLVRLRLPATFFLTIRFLDGETGGAGYWESWPHLTWREAVDLVKSGFEIGAHAVSHVPLTGLPYARLRAEAADSKKALEDRLGLEVAAFSYPHGVWDAPARRAVEEAGYDVACSGRFGLNRPPFDRFALRRTEIDGSDGPGDFRRKLEGRYDWLGRWQEWRRRA